MEASIREEYFTTNILTAPPQKLHLMVIEAAIRAAEEARNTWNHEDRGIPCEALIRAQECVAQLLAGINREADSDLADKLTALYAFVLRRLRDANLHRDLHALDEALKILKMEQQTWQMVCQRIAGQGPAPIPPESPQPGDLHFSFQA